MKLKTVNRAAAAMLALALTAALTGCGNTAASSESAEASSSSSAESSDESAAESTAAEDSAYAYLADFNYAQAFDENGYLVGIKASDYVTLPEDYTDITLSADLGTVSDASLNSYIAENVLSQFATTEQVTDRAAEDGDAVNIDFVGSIDGVEFEGGNTQGKGYDLVLGSGAFIPGFEDQIVGHNVGDEFDVNVKFPEDYHAEELKGKDSVFKVKIHEINAKELPDADDEFAKDVSEFDTLAEMKEDIKKKLTEQNEKTATTEFENKLIDEVIANMEGEIPEEMYESRIDEMIRDFDYRLRSQGMDINVYLQYTGMDMDSFRLTFKEQAEKQVKIRLALEKVVELEKIEATDEDLEKEYQRIADSYNMELDKVKTMLPAADLMADVAVNKAVDLIKDSAVEA